MIHATALFEKKIYLVWFGMLNVAVVDTLYFYSQYTFFSISKMHDYVIKFHLIMYNLKWAKTFMRVQITLKISFNQNIYGKILFDLSFQFVIDVRKKAKSSHFSQYNHQSGTYYSLDGVVKNTFFPHNSVYCCVPIYANQV